MTWAIVVALVTSYIDDAADERTLLRCISILRSEVRVTPRIFIASTLMAPTTIAGTVMPSLPLRNTIKMISVTFFIQAWDWQCQSASSGGGHWRSVLL